MALRQLASVALVLVLTVGGFLGARAIAQHEANRETEKRAEVAATQVRSGLKQSGDLVEGLRRVLVGNVGARVTIDQFANFGSSMLKAVDLAAAAWIERVPAAERAAYERRTGHRIVTTPRSSHAVYLPATLVTGSAPATVPGIDLSGEPGLEAALSRVQTLYSVTSIRRGRNGLILLESAQRVSGGRIVPGYVVLFVPRRWLVEQATLAGAVIRIGPASFGDLNGATPAATRFEMFGRPIDVLVPRVRSAGAAVALPWVILGVGILLAALTGALAVNRARRERAQLELDHIFTVSRELIAITGFDRLFKRVNPAFERVLGYSPDELVSGGTVTSLEVRFRCKDGSYRWIEWTAASVVAEQLVYSVGRDVTDRRHAEAEEAALRRVATLVAEGVRPTDVFDAVVREIRGLLGADASRLMRYDSTELGTVVATSDPGMEIPPGTSLSLTDESVAAMVVRTGRPARIANYERIPGPVAKLLTGLGTRSSVGTPIVVEGHLWGVTVAAWRAEQPESVLADAESRLTKFTELVATAIANAESRAELTASRARVVVAADEARRKIERDLHDGTQQRLVALAMDLRVARSIVPEELDELGARLDQVTSELGGVVEDLREISRGIHPGILSRGGLGPALRTLAMRSAIPVELELRPEMRFPEPVEVAAYYVVSEALTNAVKHAQASAVQVDLVAENGFVRLAISDDGVGGADPALGSGLVGLRDRVDALGGTIEIASPSGGGTELVVTLPI